MRKRIGILIHVWSLLFLQSCQPPPPPSSEARMAVENWLSEVSARDGGYRLEKWWSLPRQAPNMGAIESWNVGGPMTVPNPRTIHVPFEVVHGYRDNTVSYLRHKTPRRRTYDALLVVDEGSWKILSISDEDGPFVGPISHEFWTEFPPPVQ